MQMMTKTIKGKALHQQPISKDDLEADICSVSFYDFVKRFWDTIITEEPVWNWHIEYLCKELQIIAERVFRNEPKEYDLVINISPGSTKSTICSIMFPAWVWTRMPSARSICGSYAYNLAMDLSRKSRDIVQSDKYRRLYPSVSIREDQNTKGYFANTNHGYRYAVGTGGSVTGMHGHFIIVDDPLDPGEAVSEVELKKANRWMSETLPTRKVDKEIAVTIVIMQRLHQDDPSAHMLAKRKEGKLHIKHINLPAIINSETKKDVRPRKLRHKYINGLMDPKRLSKSVLDAAEIELGAFAFGGQYLQTPIPLGGGMFKTNRLLVDIPPPRFKRIVRFWDKAGTGGGGAFTVGLKMAEDAKGDYWILDVVRGQWESAEREAIILQTAQIDGKSVMIGVEQEPGSGGKESAQNTVKMLSGFRVRIDNPTGNKVIRADPFSVQVNAGNVKLAGKAWTEEYLKELQFFPHSKYKDQVDASSGAFTLITKPIMRLGGIK